MRSDIQSAGPIAELEWLESTADLLDNKFRIPGTQIRFGIDGLIGLVPYAGDVFTFLVGGFLIIVMYRKGASGKLVFKMISNILIDGVFGTVPFVGDIFDFRFRSHRKNVNLMIEHYEEGQHRGSAWPMIVLMLLILIGLFILSIYASAKIFGWIFS